MSGAKRRARFVLAGLKAGLAPSDALAQAEDLECFVLAGSEQLALPAPFKEVVDSRIASTLGADPETETAEEAGAGHPSSHRVNAGPADEAEPEAEPEAEACDVVRDGRGRVVWSNPANVETFKRLWREGGPDGRTAAVMEHFNIKRPQAYVKAREFGIAAGRRHGARRVDDTESAAPSEPALTAAIRWLNENGHAVDADGAGRFVVDGGEALTAKAVIRFANDQRARQDPLLAPFALGDGGDAGDAGGRSETGSCHEQ